MLLLHQDHEPQLRNNLPQHICQPDVTAFVSKITYGVAQKVSHYQESSPNCIKIASAVTLLINFEYEMSRRML